MWKPLENVWGYDGYRQRAVRWDGGQFVFGICLSTNEFVITILFGNMKPKHCYLATIALWALLCLAHFVLRTHSILTGPRNDDLYSYSWSFQLMAFLVFLFPLWCVAMAVGLLAEVWHFARHKTDEKAEQA
jgi:hypothetical protein